MPRPSFFVVGAPKCGTTSLCHYLSQHPDVFMPDPKEHHFFASDLKFARPNTSIDKYLERFASAGRPKIGESGTWYLCSTTAAERIREFNRDARIIVAVRKPADMIYSLFRFRKYIGIEESDSLAHVLCREKEYVSKHDGTGRIDHNLIYSGAAKYHEQIMRYIDVFGFSNVHLVIFDDIEGDLDKVCLNMLRFLEVSDDFQPAFRHINKTGRIRSDRFQQRIAHLPGPVKRLAYAFPRAVRRPAYRALHRLNTSYAPPPPLDPELRRRLNDDFRPEVERLSTLIGRDLSHWCAE